MKRKLVVLGTTIMATATTTACSGKDAKIITAAEVVTQADTTTGTTDGETEDVGATSDSKTAAEPQSLESASQEAALSEEVEDMSHAGAEPERSEIKPFVEKVQEMVADKDMEALAGLCVYPVYTSLGEGQGERTAGGSAFLKTDAGQIFTESLLKEIADIDADALEQFGARVIISKKNNIVFNDVDGQAAITGTNPNQSMSEHAMSGHAVKKNKISH